MRIIITLLLIILSFSGNSQSNAQTTPEKVCDSIIEIWRFPEYDTVIRKKTEFNYNTDCQVITESYFSNTKFYYGLEWKKYEILSYAYNTQGYLSSRIRQLYDHENNTWNYEDKVEYTVNSSGDSLVTYTEYYNGIWYNLNRMVFSLDSSLFWSARLYQSWHYQNQEWQNENMYDTLYNPDWQPARMNSLDWQTNPPQWDTLYYQIYDYSFSPDTLFIYKFTDNRHYRYKLYYNPIINAKIELGEVFYNDSNFYKNTSLKKIYFNQFHKRLKYIHLHWNHYSNDWVFSNMSKYEYNEDLLLTKYSFYTFDSIYPRRIISYSYYPYGKVKRKVIDNDPSNPYDVEIFDYYYSDIYTGMDTTGAELEYDVYPNPADNYVTFKTSNNKNYIISLYTMNGELLLQKKIKANNYILHINTLTAGIYIMQVKTEQRCSFRKLIVQ